MGEMYIETLEVSGIMSALKGMRNPMDSWNKSDTEMAYNFTTGSFDVEIGEVDMKLAKKLIKGGTEHRKFLRQIQVWADVKIPRYMWSEFDTYRFGTKNSCSTMHTIMKKEIVLDDFYIGNNPSYRLSLHLDKTIDALNDMRECYLETKDYAWVIEMKRILPEAFLQLRTWNSNYEEIMNMYQQRKHHRLKEEWVECFCKWCETLPYFKELCIEGNK